MWPKGPYRWTQGDTQYISIPFTFNLPEVRQELLENNLFASRTIVGGPAVQLMPEYLADVAEIGTSMAGVLQKVNPLATRTTISCPRKCGFCGIGQRRIEPEGYRELDDWPNLPIVCDNNLLASSLPHFDKVIDRLKLLPKNTQKLIDFNQGLDARLLTKHHAGRLAEIPATIRLAWDNVKNEREVMRAIELLRSEGIPKNRLRCYVLIGFKDTPEDALYRLRTLHEMGIKPNPMRYIPLDSLTRHYVDPNSQWTHKELTRMQRYWSNTRYLASVPYEEFEKETTK